MNSIIPIYQISMPSLAPYYLGLRSWQDRWTRRNVIFLNETRMPYLAPSLHWVWVYSNWILNVKRAPERASLFYFEMIILYRNLSRGILTKVISEFSTTENFKRLILGSHDGSSRFGSLWFIQVRYFQIQGDELLSTFAFFIYIQHASKFESNRPLLQNFASHIPRLRFLWER